MVRDGCVMKSFGRQFHYCKRGKDWHAGVKQRYKEKKEVGLFLTVIHDGSRPLIHSGYIVGVWSCGFKK